jgi:hypothetical protein
MTINLKIEEHIYKLFLFLRFFYIYLEVNCQDCQNNSLFPQVHARLKRSIARYLADEPALNEIFQIEAWGI